MCNLSLLSAEQFFQTNYNINTQAKKMQPQQLNPIVITKQLHHIYPDIEGELCSRHSTLFGKLKTTFNRLYDNMQPSYYVIVNGNCQIVEQQFTELSLSMALQNGVIILVTRTYSQSQLYINGNHFSQQVIFSHYGRLQQGLNTFSSQMQSTIRDSIGGLQEKQLNGGIFYVHGNIPEESFQYKEVFLMALYLGVLVVNDRLKNMNKEQIVERMAGLGFMGTREEISRRFNSYKNRMLNVSMPRDQTLVNNRETASIINLCGLSLNPNANNLTERRRQSLFPMSKEFKLLFCRLDLSKDDIRYQQTRRHEIKWRKDQLLRQLTEQQQYKHLDSLLQLFHATSTINLHQIHFNSVYHKSQKAKELEEIECEEDEEEILRHPVKFLQTLLYEIGLLNELLQGQITLEHFVNSMWQVNSTYLRLHAEEVVELVEKMKQELEIKGCMIVSQNFLLIVVHKNHHTELLCQVKNKMNRGELKSKSLFKIEEEEIVRHRWASDKAIGQKMFTSVPAEGVAVFDPSEAIWFQ